jgi:hypothetical protein
MERLARISHQAAQDTDKTLAFWSKAWIVKNTACYSSMPITVQAGLRVRKLALHSNRSYGYAFRSRAALTNTSPPVLPGGEMITQRFGLMKYIPVFHPSGVALRSKSVPDGFVTKDFTMMYCRLGIAHRGCTGGQCPPYLTVPVILARNAG